MDEAEEFVETMGMRVTTDPSGGYTFAWTAKEGDDRNIYSRSCDASGHLGLPSHAVNDLPGIQAYSDAAADNSSNKVFVWTDLREGNGDIYGTVEGVNRPIYLTVGGGFNGMVPLTWEQYYGQDDPRPFEIYRTDSQTNPFIQITTVNSPDPWVPNRKFDWIDTTAVNGTPYYYLVKVESSGIIGTSKIVTTTPSAEGHAIRSSWSAVEPAIDGHLWAGEWDDATVLDISNAEAIYPVRLYVKNTGSMLYLAVDDSNDVFVEPGTALGFLADLDHNGEWDAAFPSDEGGVTLYPVGEWFYAFWGDYPDHLGASAPVPAGGIDYLALATSGHVQQEAAIDLAASPLKAAAAGTIGFAVWSVDPGNFYAAQYGNAGQWPLGALWEAAETLGSLTLAEETSISDRSAEGPESFRLGQNYPNPFNPSTTIPFRVKESSRVTLKVYDVLGKEVAVLADGRFEAGDHTALFDASGLPSGIYVYRISAGDFTAVRKMVLIE